MKSVKELRRAAVRAEDGPIGFVEQVFFDDEKWTIRYLVLDGSEELAGKRLLVSPLAVTSVAPGDHSAITVRLTRRQVAGSPDIDTEKPVSRQKELEYNRHFLLPAYWGGAGIWGGHMLPEQLVAHSQDPTHQPPAGGDVHLRSSREVIGYRLRARDRKVGHVRDFLFDERTWSIRYIEADTYEWLGGHHVLLSPRWVDSVVWEDRSIVFSLPVQVIGSAPPYEPGTPVTAELEHAVEAHFSRGL